MYAAPAERREINELVSVSISPPIEGVVVECIGACEMGVLIMLLLLQNDKWSNWEMICCVPLSSIWKGSEKNKKKNGGLLICTVILKSFLENPEFLSIQKIISFILRVEKSLQYSQYKWT